MNNDDLCHCEICNGQEEDLKEETWSDVSNEDS